MTPPHFTSRALAGVKHGFFGREGGVSTGIYASLNAGTGSGDDPAKMGGADAADGIEPHDGGP